MTEKRISSTEYKYSYEVSCPSLEAANLEVKVLISDSIWMKGSNHHVGMESSTGVDEIYPWFYTNIGTQTIIKDVASTELNNKRNVIVYTPPSYFENTLKTYKNVLIMHDG